MPEPAAADGKDEREDAFDLDLEDHFNYPDGHASHLTQVMFVVKSVTILALLTGYMNQHLGGMTNNSMDWLGGFIWDLPHYITGYVEGQIAFLGIHPRCYSARDLCVAQTVCACTQTFIKMPVQMEASGQDHMHGGGVYQPRQMDSIQWGLALTASNVLGHIYPRRYGLRSFYGRYCCEAFPAARQTKVMVLYIVIDWTFSRAMSNVITGLSAIRDAAFQSIVLPIIVFAWKRFYFLITTILFIDDSCMKNNGFSWLFGTKLLVGNFSVALSGCSAINYSAMMSFLCVDWMLFALRSCLLLRVGQKQCTKIFNQLLDSALSSLVTPLTKVKKSMGFASAMRQMQAFSCLLEGVTLSISFVYHLVVCYVINYAIGGDEKLIMIFKGRTVGIPLVLSAADMFQDFCSNRATDKFSSWTLLFHYFVSPVMLPYFIGIFLCVSSHIKFKFSLAHIAVVEQYTFQFTSAWNVGYSQKWHF